MTFRSTIVSVIALAGVMIGSAPAQAQAAPTAEEIARAKAVLDAAGKSDKATLAAAKNAEKARQKQLKAWRAQYGPGPYPDEVDAFAATREEKLRNYYRVLYYDGEHNAVLNFERLGLLAMELGHYADAEKAFDGALDRIEAFYGKDRQALKATSATRLEVNKDYKGEPYERAMAYYYRGLLYLRKGDYDNARASFKAGEYQDSVSEKEEFQSDFALLTYLQGWASHCAGDKSQAADSFADAVKIDAKLKTPGPSDNVLVLAELGTAPLKVGDGQYKEKMVFKQASSGVGENRAIVTIGQGRSLKAWPLSPGASIYTQASTRGGRAIDGVLDGKAQTKDALNAAADVTSAATGALGLLSNNSGLGMYGQLGGLLFKGASSTVKPAADVRVWDSLPDSVLVGTAAYGVAPAATAPAKGKKGARRTGAPAAAGSDVPPASFAWMKGDTPLDLKGTPPMVAKQGKCMIIWSRSRSVGGLAPDAPGDVAAIALARKRDQANWAKDQAFRASLGGKPDLGSPTVSTAR